MLVSVFLLPLLGKVQFMIPEIDENKMYYLMKNYTNILIVSHLNALQYNTSFSFTLFSYL